MKMVTTYKHHVSTRVRTLLCVHTATHTYAYTDIVDTHMLYIHIMRACTQHISDVQYTLHTYHVIVVTEIIIL